MTFLTLRCHLNKPLATRDLHRLGQLSTVYGVRGLRIEGSDLVVEYDASRMHEAEALAHVRRVGIDVRPERDIPAGSFDSSGEFKDAPWPTTGLSPVNQKAK
jgi:hypothetical protein